MIAAALGDISRDLNINTYTAQIIFSTYFLGLAIGPFPAAGLSEITGRRGTWLFCNAWYILWNALCPLGNSKALMITGRLMTGIGASGGITITGPVMADMYGKRERRKSPAIASFLPYLGPALGPTVGGIITQLVVWPWIFWIMSIFNGLITLAGYIFIRESYTQFFFDERPNPETSSHLMLVGCSVLNIAKNYFLSCLLVLFALFNFLYVGRSFKLLHAYLGLALASTRS
ncbi:hypothetical protein EAF04_002531 [Stromatinia cepivora]|nr:hypothetical protein EAF04_002531 [Stromatinia cepivora]